MYTPKPIDTKDIQLSQDLLEAAELISANAHDVWAKNRMSEGWTYGSEKDSRKMTTPNLVPYEELPESEKDYDRNTVSETIKLLIKFGYSIKKDP